MALSREYGWINWRETEAGVSGYVVHHVPLEKEQ
jgi:hypothetical protein